MNIYKSSEFEKIVGAKHYFLLNEYTILYWNEEEKQYVIANIDPERTDYTFEDYLKLPDYAPYELMNGKLIFMSSPTLKHQKVLLKLSSLLNIYNEKHKLGEVFFAPLDVRFDEQNCCQPDLLFISLDRFDIMNEKRVNDAPDMTAEILSSNAKDDLIRKMAIYAKFGVSEYWIIDLKIPKIEVYENHDGEMILSQTAYSGGIIQSKVIKGFVLELNRIFV